MALHPLFDDERVKALIDEARAQDDPIAALAQIRRKPVGRRRRAVIDSFLSDEERAALGVTRA